jgi:atypical dual specificity phosphatase
MTEPLLALERFGVAFGQHVVLTNVRLEIAPRGMHVLVGPAGAGKSTLLRTLAGLNDSQPALRRWGRARFGEGALGEGLRPALVQQNARLLVCSVRENLVSALADRASLSLPAQAERVREALRAHALDALEPRLSHDVVSLDLGEQRLVAILRGAMSGAELLLVDEPTAGLDASSADAVVRLLRSIASERAVVVVTHHQRHARALGGWTSLLAAGRIVESAPTERFFTAPESPLAQRFVETGGCSDAGPSVERAMLEEGVAYPTPLPPAIQRVVSESAGPRGFYWALQGRLGGLPRPGVVTELDRDLEGLARLGVTVLVTLEERETVSSEALAVHGIRLVHVPIPDMHAPSLETAARLCERVDAMLAAGDVVAVHCLAGLGRTGTVLAAYLVWRGQSALDAIERVRAIKPRSIQSVEQAEFLTRFAEVRASRG